MHIGKVNGQQKKSAQRISERQFKNKPNHWERNNCPGKEKIGYIYIYIFSLKGNLHKQVEQDYEAGGTDGKMEQTDGKTLFKKKKINLFVKLQLL